MENTNVEKYGPVKEAGCRTDPPVSEPMEAEQMPEETEAAEPPELPPQVI